MSVKNYLLLLYIEDEDGVPIEGGPCPVAFRDVDESIAWTEGTHINGGLWKFAIPSGIASGIKWGVQTSAGTFTEDDYLSGSPSGDNLGQYFAPVQSIEG